MREKRQRDLHSRSSDDLMVLQIRSIKQVDVDHFFNLVSDKEVSLIVRDTHVRQRSIG